MERCIKESDLFTLLPDDLLLDILRKLPRDMLRHNTKFVCKRWFILTTNNILMDQSAFLVPSRYSDKVSLIYTTEGKQGLNLKDRYLGTPYNVCPIKSWCNELLLMITPSLWSYNPISLYVYDLFTRQGAFLPPCSITACGGHYGGKCGLGLSYDKFKRVYKVVHAVFGPEIQCELLLILKSNITSDSYNSLRWKKIDVPHFTGQSDFGWGDPVSVQGRYFHWDVLNEKYLVSLDTVKERFCETLLPGSDLFATHKMYFWLEMGGFLTLFHNVSQDKINIWRLHDYESSNWEKAMSVTISSDVWSSIYIGFRAIRVISKRYIIFQPKWKTALYSYDLKSKMIETLALDFASGEHIVVQTTSFMPSE